jgi:hypothetical protein
MSNISCEIERKRTNKQKRQDNGKKKTQRNKRFEVEKKEESG